MAFDNVSISEMTIVFKDSNFMSYLRNTCRYLPFRSCGCLLRLSKTRLPSLAKAAFVGANTVKASPAEIQS
jgi:hypothetical protein